MKTLFHITLLWISLYGGLALAPSKTNGRTPMELDSIERRNLLKYSLPTFFGLAPLMTQGRAALAAGSPPTPEELARIKEGYKQIQYLLANFEQETTICRENGGECKRDAGAIRKGRY